jgi:hypothetical protein
MGNIGQGVGNIRILVIDIEIFPLVCYITARKPYLYISSCFVLSRLPCSNKLLALRVLSVPEFARMLHVLAADIYICPEKV